VKYILVSVEDDKFDALLEHYQHLAEHPASSVVAAKEQSDDSPLERYRAAVEHATEADGPPRYNADGEPIPGPDSEYVKNLRKIADDPANDRTARYRAEAELEDMTDGHWDGPRTDDPPPNWWTTGDPATGKWDSENGVLILPEDI
jgi:hypothetical protein